MIRKLFLITILSVPAYISAVSPVVIEHRHDTSAASTESALTGLKEAECDTKIRVALDRLSTCTRRTTSLSSTNALAAMALTKNLAQALLSKNITVQDVQEGKETKESIEKTLTFLERVRAVLLKMSAIISQADELCTKITALIVKLILIRDLCF